MKVKDGSGKELKTKRLQTLRSQLYLDKKLNRDSKYFSRSKNSLDSRVWSTKDSIGPIAQFDPDKEHREAIDKILAHFDVFDRCRKNWQLWNSFEREAGSVCVCGHPERGHSEGLFCLTGDNVCFCPKFVRALVVSDIRFFYQVTLGPHDAHALSRGLRRLSSKGGTYSLPAPWTCCSKNCSNRTKVGPVRVRGNGGPSLGLSVNDKHVLMCERCLVSKLNGSH